MIRIKQEEFSPGGIQMTTPIKRKQGDNYIDLTDTHTQSIDRNIRHIRRSELKANRELEEVNSSNKELTSSNKKLKRTVQITQRELTQAQENQRNTQIELKKLGRQQLQHKILVLRNSCERLLGQLQSVRGHQDEVNPLKLEIQQLRQQVAEQQTDLDLWDEPLEQLAGADQKDELLEELTNQDRDIEESTELCQERKNTLEALEQRVTTILATYHEEKTDIEIQLKVRERATLDRRLSDLESRCGELLDLLNQVQGYQNEVNPLKLQIQTLQGEVATQKMDLNVLDGALAEFSAADQKDTLLQTLQTQEDAIRRVSDALGQKMPRCQDLQRQVNELVARPPEKTMFDTLKNAAKVGTGLIIGGVMVAAYAYTQYTEYTGSLD